MDWIKKTDSSKLFILELNLTRIRNQRWAPARIQLNFFTFFFCSAYCRVSMLRSLWLALTLVELIFVHKSIHVDRKSSVYVWNLRLLTTCERTCESVWPPNASSGFKPAAKTCIDLRVHLARALENKMSRVEYSLARRTKQFSLVHSEVTPLAKWKRPMYVTFLGQQKLVFKVCCTVKMAIRTVHLTNNHNIKCLYFPSRFLLDFKLVFKLEGSKTRAGWSFV